jgi:hypothetical protein
VTVFTIWREQSTGGFVLVAGDRPPAGGDICMRRIQTNSWELAIQALHQFTDTMERNGAVT